MAAETTSAAAARASGRIRSMVSCDVWIGSRGK